LVFHFCGLCSSWRRYLEFHCHYFCFFTDCELGSWDSAVGIATGYGLDDREVKVGVPVESRIFSSPHRPDQLWGPPNLLSNGYSGGGALSPGVKRPGHEADHSPPTSAEVENLDLYNHSPIHLHGIIVLN
jgi:hypothetical protein